MLIGANIVKVVPRVRNLGFVLNMSFHIFFLWPISTFIDCVLEFFYYNNIISPST
jgi:hypothetical protein